MSPPSTALAQPLDGDLFHSDPERFRLLVRDWFATALSGEFSALRGVGGPGREHEAFDERLVWDRHLAAAGLTCIGWPVEHGGRGATMAHQVVFHEEYARADAPARVNHLGEELLGPTLIAFGTPAQRTRFLPGIVGVRELWCQGYSEPNAGSDLAAVRTRAVLDGDRWVIDGQKVWTSLAHVSDWCFLLARTDQEQQRHRGLSYLLVPMRQPGVEVRPIQQLTGTSEFNEVFFTGADTEADLVVGEVGDGWRVALGTLAMERGISTLGQQVGFRRELDALVELARATGALEDPALRDKLVRARIGLEVMHAHARRTLGSDAPGAASVSKLVWAAWHRGLGELAMEVLGAASLVARGEPYDLDRWQRLFLFSRADTIYGGSDEVQRTILAERVLGLPRAVRR
ncbi:acyl-CoA dehydrogenase family protein [Pseudonocardia spinosispora]|uniref:acyl-CoA dehydrogenase family protein n=1 Tax=Pseudonocardia spinosispora TaxID=103441 RepID=UPI000402BE9B|nr:acyl-CoA dehydrogenase family protein [Pseudonocardia spinosispora]